MKRRCLKIWIDFENSPHVLFFEPIIRALEGQGCTVIVTARNFCNTIPLCTARNIPVRKIGNGYEMGRQKHLKWLHWIRRVSQLARFAESYGFDVAVSHGSRTQAVAACRLGIRTFATTDYEYADLRAFRRTTCFMLPDVIPKARVERMGIPRRVIRDYAGLKEHVYLSNRPRASNLRALVRAPLNIPEDEILVTFRPFSDTAHYGHECNYGLQTGILDYLLDQGNAHVALLPRTRRQLNSFKAYAGRRRGVRVCNEVIDGPSLICASDLVVTGGGTMLREAAALGVPAVSFFGGRLGAVDEFLCREGKVAVIKNVEEMPSIKLASGSFEPVACAVDEPLQTIVQGILETA